MERGSEGFFIVNKAGEKLDEQVLDMMLTNLEGYYRELRNNFSSPSKRTIKGRNLLRVGVHGVAGALKFRGVMPCILLVNIGVNANNYESGQAVDQLLVNRSTNACMVEGAFPSDRLFTST